jgi:hypothetical protein
MLLCGYRHVVFKKFGFSLVIFCGEPQFEFSMVNGNIHSDLYYHFKFDTISNLVSFHQHNLTHFTADGNFNQNIISMELPIDRIPSSLVLEFLDFGRTIAVGR